MDYGDTGGEWDYPMGRNRSTVPKYLVGEIRETEEITYEINPQEEKDVNKTDDNLLNEIE